MNNHRLYYRNFSQNPEILSPNSEDLGADRTINKRGSALLASFTGQRYLSILW